MWAEQAADRRPRGWGHAPAGGSSLCVSVGSAPAHPVPSTIASRESGRSLARRAPPWTRVCAAARIASGSAPGAHARTRARCCGGDSRHAQVRACMSRQCVGSAACCKGFRSRERRAIGASHKAVGRVVGVVALSQGASRCLKVVSGGRCVVWPLSPPDPSVHMQAPDGRGKWWRASPGTLVAVRHRLHRRRARAQ